MELQEIIWEITGRCKNGCNFCGSKSKWNEEIDEKKILNIARKIVYDKSCIPKAIDISGGDPLLVSYQCHKELISVLKSGGVECKMVINPKSAFSGGDVSLDKLEIIKLYDYIGISINSKEEADAYGLLVELCDNTVITNFNLQNLFHFEKIDALVKKHNVPWMCQFTIYNEKSDLALYEDCNEEALAELCSKLQTAANDGIKIILSDNCNTGQCTAGSRSLGILSNGDVVPCLSMRSWVKDEDLDIQGNILDTQLSSLWEHEFYNYRFECFKCCKDHCNNKSIAFIDSKTEKSELWDGCKTLAEFDELKELDLLPNPKLPNPQIPIVMMYAVSPMRENTPFVYGVSTFPPREVWPKPEVEIRAVYGTFTVRDDDDIRFVYGTFGPKD